MAVVRLKMLPKQKAFVMCDAKEVLYSGAFGGGKSFAICAKTVKRAGVKGAREGLLRKNLSDLKGTTLKTLLDGDGPTPPVLPLGSYRHYKADRIISINGGGEIVYFSLEDTSTIGSYNLTGAGVDQAEELTVDDWFFLKGRLRVDVPGLSRQLYAVCNPDSPSHHLAIRFGLAPDVLEPQPGCWVITTTSMDNPHLPADYVADLMTFTGVRKKRFVLGQWVGSDGIIYENWDRSVHVQERRITADEIAHVTLCIDDGTTVPFACLRMVKLRSGHKHIDRMVYRRGMLPHEKVAAVESMEPFDIITCDPAAAALKLDLRAKGFEVRNGDNQVIPGIHEVQKQLGIAPDGLPWLTVSGQCRDLIREMETYEWDDDGKKEKPVKENDHAADALRYGCMEDRLPAAVAVDNTTARKLSESLPEENTPRFCGDIEPRTGWSEAGDILLRKGKPEGVEFITDPDQPDSGNWRLYCELMENDRPNQERLYLMAISVGTGAPGSMSVIKIGDAEAKRVIAECVLPNATPDVTARVAAAAGIWFGGREGKARAIWQHAGGGIAFTDLFRRLSYHVVYHHVEEGVQSDEPGWRWTPSAMVSLLSNLQNEIKAGRYHEATRATIMDLQRWAYTSSGTVAPFSQAAEGESYQNASDRALAAMLLAHAFSWAARLPLPKPRAEVGSIEWLEKHEKNRRGPSLAALRRRSM